MKIGLCSSDDDVKKQRAMARSRVLCALALGAPLLIEGGPILFKSVLIGLTLYAGILFLSDRVRTLTPLLSPLLLGSWLSVIYALITLIPIPLSTLGTLSSSVQRGWLAAHDLGGATQWTPLSLSPAHTIEWITLQLTFILIAYLSAHLHLNRRLALYALSAIGPLLMLIGVVHSVSGAQRVYGLYQSHDLRAMSGFFTPVINSNTSASLMILSACIAAGVACHQTQFRLLLLGAVIMSGAGVVLNGARSGVLFLAIALGFIFWKAIPLNRRRSVSVIYILGGFSALFFSMEEIQRMIIDLQGGSASVGESLSLKMSNPTPYPKFEVWANLNMYIKEYGWIGSGRGSFGEVFPQFQQMRTRRWISHPENHVLQQCTEAGVIGMIGSCLLPLMFWVQWIKRARGEAHMSAYGIWIALGAVGAHQCFDYGFERYGLSIPVAIAWGLLWSYLTIQPSEIDQSLLHRQTMNRRRIFIGTQFALSLCLLSIWMTRGHQLRVEVDGLLMSAQENSHERRAEEKDLLILRRGREALSWHPLSHHITFNVSANLSSTSAMLEKWIKGSLKRMPIHGQSYRLAARHAIINKIPLASLYFNRALTYLPWRRHAIYPELNQPTPLNDLTIIPNEMRYDYLKWLSHSSRSDEGLKLIDQMSDDEWIDRPKIRRWTIEVSLRKCQTVRWGRKAVQKWIAYHERSPTMSDRGIELDIIYAEALSKYCQGESRGAIALMNQVKPSWFKFKHERSLHEKRVRRLKLRESP